MTAPDPIALALHEAREYVSLDRDMPGGPRLLMLIDEALRALAASGEDESKYDNAMFNVGVQHVVDLLAKTIEAEGWVAGDGFEDYDDDLAQTLLNILVARGLYDKEEGKFAALAAPVEAKPVAWRRIRDDGVITYWETQVPDSIPLYVTPPASPSGVELMSKVDRDDEGNIPARDVPADEDLIMFDLTNDKLWNEGCDFALSQLCKYLGVDAADVVWDAATETVEGDVATVIGNIMQAKYGDDFSPQLAVFTARRSPEKDSPSPDLRGALEAAREFVALCAKPAFGARTCLAKIDAALAATGGKE